MHDQPVVVPPVPPTLLDIIGEKEHIKLILPLSNQPISHQDDRDDGAVKASTSRVQIPTQEEMLVIVSNVDNADDVELSALLLLDTREWKALAVVPILPGLIQVQSTSPDHLRILLNPGGKSTADQSRELLQGWSSQSLLVQDFRLLLSQMDEATSPQLSQTRWLWLKKYATHDQFVSIKKLLDAHKDSKKSPVWAKFSTSLTSPGKSPKSPTSSPSSLSGLRIAAFTYNVAGCTPPQLSTRIPFFSTSSLQGADIAVIGLQEVDVSSSAYLFFDPQRQDAWTRSLLESLNRSDQPRDFEWQLAAVKQHVTILLLVFLRLPLNTSQTGLNSGTQAGVHLELSELLLTTVGVGLGGFMANKGAVAARFRISRPSSGSSMTICLIVAHLSAGVGRIAMERRIWDWAEIGKRLRFKAALSETPAASLEDAERYEEWGILDHDYVILLGDLNSRLPLSLSANSVQRMIRKGALGRRLLRSYDELAGHLALANEDGSTAMVTSDGSNTDLSALATDEASLLVRELWRDWKEGDVSEFAPTYKVDPGTNTYDTSEKQRVPSWTDRVLWFESAKEDKVALEKYDAVLEGGGVQSDHLPVYAILRISME